MTVTVSYLPTSQQVCSAIRVRCVDCREVVCLAPFEFNPYFGQGLLDPRDTARRLAAHAREKPILHPTIMCEHHGTGRTAGRYGC